LPRFFSLGDEARYLGIARARSSGREIALLRR